MEEIKTIWFDGISLSKYESVSINIDGFVFDALIDFKPCSFFIIDRMTICDICPLLLGSLG